MSEKSLDHHEVDVARVGRVRLPRFRSVASVTTVGLLLGAAAMPVFADTSRSAAAPPAGGARDPAAPEPSVTLPDTAPVQEPRPDEVSEPAPSPAEEPAPPSAEW